MEEAKNIIVKYAKKIGKKFLKVVLLPLIIIALIVIIFAGSTYVIIKWQANVVAEKATEFTSSITIDSSGHAKSSITATELWNQMEKAGYDLDKYLNGPEDLEKLLKAELVTQLPDTRSNVEQEIDWDAIFKKDKEKTKKKQTSNKDSKVKGKINVLFVGNSKTFANWDLPKHFQKLAESLDKEVHAVMTKEYWGGRSLLNWLDASDPATIDFRERLQEEKWDYVVLQEQTETSLYKESLTQGAKGVIDYVKEHNNPDVIPIYDAWGPFNNYSEEEYGIATNNYEAAKAENGGTMAYIARALLAYHKLYPDEELWLDDTEPRRHPNPAGTYLAACCTFGAIYGEETKGATYTMDLPEEQIKQIQEVCDDIQAGVPVSAFDGNAKEKDIQGIIKFKRHDENGREFYITYANPIEFQNQMEIYNRTGSDEAKNFIVNHYTLKERNKNTGSGSGIINGTGSFPKYNLTDEQVKEIANLCNAEQGTPEGAAAEASLMANIFESRGSNYNGKTGADGLYNFIRWCGWWSPTPGSPYMKFDAMKTGESSEEQVQAVKNVLVKGCRTLPKYINEHDWVGDLVTVTNNGNVIDKNNHSQYVQFVSQCKQDPARFGGGGTTWTFYCFPQENSDPFGYTSESERQKYGDFCYEYGTWKPINGTEDKSKNDVEALPSSGSGTSTSSSIGQQVVDYVKSKLGCPYVWATAGPDTFDCSGLTSAAYASAGVEISRNDQAQHDDPQFEQIPVSQAQPGDILWHSGHVGIYIGNDEFIHAPKPGDVVSQWPMQYGGWECALHLKNSGSANTGNNNSSSAGGDFSQATGDGYFQTYTSSFGITYKDYKQNRGSYAGQGYNGSTIAAIGCGVTATATVLSGLGIDKGPSGVGNDLNGIGTMYGALERYFKGQGINATEVSGGSPCVTANYMADLIKQGKAIIGRYDAGSAFAGVPHFISIVDYNSLNGKFLVLDSYDQIPGSRWCTPAEVQNGIHQMTAVDMSRVAKNKTNTSTSTNKNNSNNKSIEVGFKQVYDDIDQTGYAQTYTSSTGRTYKDFKQIPPAPYSAQTALACDVVSATIILSSFAGCEDLDPSITVREMSYGGDTGYFASKGINAVEIGADVTAESIEKGLKEGKVYVAGYRNNPAMYYGYQHYVAIVDMNSNGEFMVLNPGFTNPAYQISGWISRDAIAQGAFNFIEVDTNGVGVAVDTNPNSDSSSDDNDSQDFAPGYQAVVGVWTETQKTVETGGVGVDEAAEALGIDMDTKTIYVMKEAEVNYEEMVAPYTLSFDLLWSLLVIGQSRDFVMDLADLAYHSEIEVGIYDNQKTTTDGDSWKYEEATSTFVIGSFSYKDDEKKISANDFVNHKHLYSEDDPTKTEDGYIKKTHVTYEGRAEMALTKAYTWIGDYDAKYTFNKKVENTQTDNTKLDDQRIEGWQKGDIEEDNCDKIKESIDNVVKDANEQIKAWTDKRNKKETEKQAPLANGARAEIKNEPELITEEDVDKSGAHLFKKIDRVEIEKTTTKNVTNRTYTPETPIFKIRDGSETEEVSSSSSSTRTNTPFDPKITEGHYGEYDYYLYQARPNSTGQPIIISLHGSGEMGQGLGALRYGGSLARFILDKTRQPDAIVLMPSSPGDWNTTSLKQLIDHIVEETNADKSHITITGVSMGGIGAWNMLKEYPDMFESASPIASTPFNNDSLRNCKARVLAISGGDGNNAQDAVDAINSGGGNATQTWVHGASHGELCNIYGNDQFDPTPFLLETVSSVESTDSANSTIITTKMENLDNFLFIGDSRYDSVEEISNIGNNVTNLGVGSARIDEWRDVAKAGGRGVIQPTTKWRREVDITGSYSGISIQLGANSMWFGVDKAFTQMKDLIEALRKLHPNTPIFVNSCLPDDEGVNEINAFNSKVQQYCNESDNDNVYYIDVSTNLVDGNGLLKRQYTFDGTHLSSGEALRIFADNIKNGVMGKDVQNGPNKSIVEVAEKLWKEKVWHSGKVYAVGQHIPITVNSICCSSWTSWILYEYGYTDFGNREQLYTVDFYTTNWKEKYGWYEINLGPGENCMDQVQPGDMIVRDPGDNNGHITFVAKVENGRAYGYDCGSQAHWEVDSVNGEPIDVSGMALGAAAGENRPGKLIRVSALPGRSSSRKKKMESFVTLFNKTKYRDNRNNILSAPEWLFEILAQNNKTKNMVDTMKYLLYKATGTNYGVTKLDESLFGTEKLNNARTHTANTGNNGISSDFITFLESMEGAGEKSGEDYVVYYTPVDGCLNIGSGVVVKFADGSTRFTDLIGEPYVGQIVPKETYEKIYYGEIKESYDALDAELAAQGVTLTSYQRDAIISFNYNVGPAYTKQIIAAYKEGGNEGYWNFTKNYVYSQGQWLLGLQRRREQEYKLFTTGVYEWPY